MWQPGKVHPHKDLKSEYKPLEIMDMLKDLNKVEPLTYSSDSWDQEQIVQFNNFTNYTMQNRNSQLKENRIINIVMPESARKYLDIEIGKPNLKLCTYKELDCFRARVVMLVISFPGVWMTSHYS